MKRRLFPLAGLAAATLALLFCLSRPPAACTILLGGDALSAATFRTARADGSAGYFTWRGGQAHWAPAPYSREMRAFLREQAGELAAYERSPLGELAIVHVPGRSLWRVELLGPAPSAYAITQPGRLQSYSLDAYALYLHFLTPDGRVSIQRLAWSDGQVLEQWVDLADLNLSAADVQQLWYDDRRSLLLIANTRPDLPLMGYDFSCGCVRTLPVDCKPFQAFGLAEGYLFAAPHSQSVQLYYCDRALQVVDEAAIPLGPLQAGSLPQPPFALAEGRLYGIVRGAGGGQSFFAYDVAAGQLTDQVQLPAGDYTFRLSAPHYPTLQ